MSRKQVPPLPRIWNVPYPRNPFFSGREQLVEDLHSHLAQINSAALTQPPALTGLGGIGKTQIALEYAYRYRNEYQAVLWVNAASLETLIEGFVSIARLLVLPVKDEQDQSIIIEAAKQWLANSEHWLLILDNADDLEMVSDFLPTTSQGHLLLTTRAGATGSLAQNFRVEKMNEHEGVFFLLRRAKILTSADASLTQISRADQTLATAIVNELDGFPLALDQAGAYLEETPSTLDTYLKSYRRRHLELLSERGSDRYHHVPVAATWSLNFEQVERLDPPAAELLRFLAFLAPDAIPEDLIVAGASELGPQLEVLATDETRLDRPIKTLSRFSLVQRNLDQHLLVIHRLVQAILQARMTEETRHQWAERTVRAMSKAFPSGEEVATWQQYERYLPHALVCVELIETYAFAFTEATFLLNQVAFYLYERAHYAEAEPLYQRALVILEQLLGPEHPDKAKILTNLAKLYHALGKYDQAEKVLLQALAISKETEHHFIAKILNNLARLLTTQGKYTDAESLLLKALTICEQFVGHEQHETASVLTSLGLLYRIQGKYDQAEQLYLQALTICEKCLPPDHPDIAVVLNNLARLYRTQERYTDVEKLYLRALSIRKTTLGPDHPHTANTLNNLAMLYYTQGEYSRSESLYLQVITIYEKTKGPEHPEIATFLNNLAILYYAQNRLTEAESLYLRALSHREKFLGPEHPDTSNILNNLALFYVSQSKNDQAESLFLRALTIREKVFGQEHPNTIEIRENYADLLLSTDQIRTFDEFDKYIRLLRSKNGPISQE